MRSPPDVIVDRTIELVRDRAGLRVTSRTREPLARFVEARIRELGTPGDEYVRQLERSSPSSGELELLIRELTVGETYFFRGPPQFDVLRHHVIPDLLETRGKNEPKALRVLSAGCATGEEPYSLAITLRQSVPDLEDWKVSVLGIDINTTFLRRAPAGGYSEWSLRGVPDSLRARYFHREGTRFQLDDDIRNMVRFRYFNLAVDPLPAPALGIVAMDLIVCQNVLYYFERSLRKRVLERLASCLAPDGWLMLGPADLLDVHVPHCSARVFDDVVIYQRTERPSISPATFRPPNWRGSPPRPPTWRPPSLKPPPVPEVPDVPPPAPMVPALEDGIELANSGDLRGAVELFDMILEADPENARAHLLHGFLLLELGSPDAALHSLRRALYLDQSLLLAHAGIAMLARRLGLDDLAKRHASRVRSLASQHEESDAVEGWEGMTTGRLLRLFEEEEARFGRAEGQP